MQSFQSEDSQLSQPVPSQVEVDDGQQGTLEAPPPLKLELSVLSAACWPEFVTKKFLQDRDGQLYNEELTVLIW